MKSKPLKGTCTMTAEHHCCHPEPNHVTKEEDSRRTLIIGKFKDSFISQLDPSLSINHHHSSLIQTRLRRLFRSFPTPTHPPYALMISRAITELNEGTGSTEEEISEFIAREYKDLPRAHVKILALQLRKLCRVGELGCAEGGRYVLLLAAAVTEQCRGSKKRKRAKRRGNQRRRKVAVERCEGVENLKTGRDSGLQEEGIKERAEVSEFGVGFIGVVETTKEESKKEGCERVGQQSQITEEEAPTQNGLEESHDDRDFMLQTICSSRLTKLSLPIDSQQPLLAPISEGLTSCLLAEAIGLSPAQLQLQMLYNGHSESSLDGAANVSGSLSTTQFQQQMSSHGHQESFVASKVSGSLSSWKVQEHEQDEKPMSVDPELQHLNYQCRGNWPRKCKKVANYKGESLLPSSADTVSEQKPNGKEIDKGWLSQPQGKGKDQGECPTPKLRRNVQHINKKIQSQDQTEDLACSYSNQKETSYSSQPTAANFHVDPTHNLGQQVVVPTPERSSYCVISTGIKLLPVQLRMQIPSDVDLGMVSKGKDALTCASVHDEQLQQEDQAKQRGRGRGRGRPPKRKEIQSNMRSSHTIKLSSAAWSMESS